MSRSSAHVLAGDIGGTKTLLQISLVADGAARALAEQRYGSGDFADFSSLLQNFLAAAPAGTVDAVCIGVAGPIAAGRSKVTNLPWELDEAEIGGLLRAPARLINDFAAVGEGIAELGEADLLTLQAGEAETHGVRAVIGAGTGLGMGTLCWSDGDYRVLASEGSHADFGPGSELELRLLGYLGRRYGHVSWERAVSGPGIAELYEFLLSEGQVPGGALLAALANGADPSAVLADFALRRADPVALQTLELFVDLYGAAAGNLALAVLPRGGLFVAGGIAPRILPLLTDGRFMERFRAKGRFRGLLSTLPVHVVTQPQVGLMGARRVAARMAAGR